MMRNRMERLVVLPFSMGSCVSHTSVAVVTDQSKKPKAESNTTVTRIQEGDENSADMNMKKYSRNNFLAIPKPNISNGIHRLIRSFRNFSQLFVYKEEMEEMEMEIGLPTNVKHVTHIGWDGSTTNNPIKGWENLKTPQEILSFPTISLMQFELAMASQADQPLGPNTSKFA